LINLLLVLFEIQNCVWVYTSKARGKEVVQELPAAVGAGRLAIRPSKTVVQMDVAVSE